MKFQEPDKDCTRCPRLRTFLLELRHKYPSYHNAPVPSFGDQAAQLLIVGLAPGLHGANRTGRPFTGDGAGLLLYKALAEYGFSTGIYDARVDDDLRLKDVLITNAVRCLPPQNKPTGTEASTCRSFLKAQIHSLTNLKAILALGQISHKNCLYALNAKPKEFPFGHHTIYQIRPTIRLYTSYHCSRYNTQTRRLTETMFFDIFSDIKDYVSN